ncbi:M28 family peptidase [Halalkalibacter akibai]|uniref:M28 family peptidase n=1 Tax=Halalkalibacter akibai TaxID=1411 RepID=UPI000551C091|nr:M28 family peptidase [Halalkalibacter akibai]
MNKKKVLVSSLLIFISFLLICGGVSAQVTYHPSLTHKTGSLAYEHTKYLANEIGQRIAGSENERLAEQYIFNQFKQMGFETEVQEFTYVRRGAEFKSSNVIAYKPGKSKQQIIVGAHYDSVSVGKGVDDNASGVGVMLETAKVLEKIKTPYSIVFIAFGAEEVGLQGSNYYASKMTEAEIANTISMINLDSLAVGDHMYVHGSAGEDGFLRDQALAIAAKKKIDLQINPGLNPAYPAGTTGDWSDHAPFKRLGIPYAYFEATNWEIGEQDGYDQTADHGGIWHTSNDTLEFIEATYPGRIQKHLTAYSTVLTDLLKFANKTSTAK